MRAWSGKTEIAVERFITWLEVPRGKFFDWQKRYGKANEHNGLVPRDHWLLDEEKCKIIAFHDRFVVTHPRGRKARRAANSEIAARSEPLAQFGQRVARNHW